LQSTQKKKKKPNFFEENETKIEKALQSKQECCIIKLNLLFAKMVIYQKV